MVVPTRSRVRISIGMNFRSWVKKSPRCARRKAWPSQAWARVRGFFRGREKPCYFLLMKNGGVRLPLRPRFLYMSYHPSGFHLMFLTKWVYLVNQPATILFSYTKSAYTSHQLPASQQYCFLITNQHQPSATAKRTQ